MGTPTTVVMFHAAHPRTPPAESDARRLRIIEI